MSSHVSSPNAAAKIHPQSWRLLDATPTLGVLAVSSCSVEPWVASVRLPKGSWNEIARTTVAVDLMGVVESEVIEFETDTGLSYDGILWRNKVPGPKPLLVYPHGGEYVSMDDCALVSSCEWRERERERVCPSVQRSM
jgi:hypothetical protein